MAEHMESAIHLPSQLTIRQIEQVYRQCEEALKGSGNLLIDASEVSKIDTSGVQLLLALKAELDQQHSTLEWVGISNAMRDAVRFIGVQHLLENSV